MLKILALACVALGAKIGERELNRIQGLNLTEEIRNEFELTKSGDNQEPLRIWWEYTNDWEQNHELDAQLANHEIMTCALDK